MKRANNVLRQKFENTISVHTFSNSQKSLVYSKLSPVQSTTHTTDNTA